MKVKMYEKNNFENDFILSEKYITIKKELLHLYADLFRVHKTSCGKVWGSKGKFIRGV